MRWRDFEVFTCGPWCQGPMLAQALRMIEAAGGLKGLAHNSADYIHLVTEILKAACADREYRYGDPVCRRRLGPLLSDAHVLRVSAIDRERAMPDMPPPIGRYPGNMPPPAAASRARSDAVVEPDTSYCCAVDRWGNAMSATPSDGSWRSPVIPGLGIVPSGRGTQSRPDPSHPSGVAPGKRPRLHPIPPSPCATTAASSRSARRAAIEGEGQLQGSGTPSISARISRGDRAAARRHFSFPTPRALHPPARPHENRVPAAARSRDAPPRPRRREGAGPTRRACSVEPPARQPTGSCAPADSARRLCHVARRNAAGKDKGRAVVVVRFAKVCPP